MPLWLTVSCIQYRAKHSPICEWRWCEFSICCCRVCDISARKCGTMRSNCGRTMHIYFSLFPLTHSNWSGVNNFLTLLPIFISSKFPFVLLAFIAAQFHNIIHSSATRSNSHSLISLKLCSAYFMSVIPKNFPHAFYTRSIAHIYLFQSLFWQQFPTNTCTISKCLVFFERGRDREIGFRLCFGWRRERKSV